MKTIFTLTLTLFIHVLVFSQITAFTAQLKTDKVDLKWAATSEKNISHFSIEKSSDGKNYNQAGIVFAFGNSSEPMMYPFIDKSIDSDNEGVIYYRISAVDNNGKTEIFQEKTIAVKKATTEFLMGNMAGGY
ncbi:MAG: hypothetical protein ACSLE0_04115 [Chitinophagaceae bacterium]